MRLILQHKGKHTSLLRKPNSTHFFQVVDLVEDLRDGTVLCSLVEALQGRRLKGWNPNPGNQHHKLDNVTTALQAIEDDGVKLVNIGKAGLLLGISKIRSLCVIWVRICKKPAKPTIVALVKYLHKLLSLRRYLLYHR